MENSSVRLETVPESTTDLSSVTIAVPTIRIEVSTANDSSKFLAPKTGLIPVIALV